MQKKQLYLLVTATSFLGWLWLMWNWQYYNLPRLRNGLILCPFRYITGYPCPSCGSTHSALQIFRLHFGQAFYTNPFGYVIAIGMIIFPLWILLDVATNKSSFYRFYHRAEGFLRIRWVIILLIFVVAINWLWNLYKYSL